MNHENGNVQRCLERQQNDTENDKEMQQKSSLVGKDPFDCFH